MPSAMSLRRSAALQHAKAVLLVDDGQRQVRELHLLLDHGVRAHHQAVSPEAICASICGARSFCGCR